MAKVEITGMTVEDLKSLKAQVEAALEMKDARVGPLEDVVNSIRASKEKHFAAAKAGVTSAIKSFLEAHPEVHSIRWTQYAPFFNDGDACTFSVHAPEVRLVDPADSQEHDEDGEDYVGEWSLGYHAKEAGKPEPVELMADLKSLSELFDDAEDAMEDMFGDGFRVTVGRDLEAQVEEYSHE